jgi:murein DD-endopeptidase MepM/ murein hydrolase activator NlpD
MKINKRKINIFLIINIIIIFLVIINISDYNLNSLLIDYDDSFVINEVNTETKSTTNNTTISASLTSKNYVADLNNWTFPVKSNYAITTYYSSSHKALDIYSYNGYGTDILAANNGTVITVRTNCSSGNLTCNGRRGNYIVINHNNSDYYTVYMHLDKSYVKEGDIVTSGDIIAAMGNTGNVIPVPTSSNPYGGTHLHFCLFIGEPYNGGYAINPYNVY